MTLPLQRAGYIFEQLWLLLSWAVVLSVVLVTEPALMQYQYEVSAFGESSPSLVVARHA